jgi:hypothetical protein
VAQVAGPVQAGDDHGDGAVTFLAAVEQPEGLGDPARGLVFGERDRALVEPGVRVGRGVTAVRHRHPAEVLAGRAELVHVAPRHHGDRGGRGGDAHRIVPAIVDARGGGRGGRARRDPAEPASGPLVQRPVTDHHAGPPVATAIAACCGRARRAAAVADLAEETSWDAELAGDRVSALLSW